MPSIDEIPLDDWPGTRRFRYRVTTIDTMHFGDVFLKAYPDFESELRRALDLEVETECTLHKEKKQDRPGIRSAAWERAAQRQMAEAGWQREITVREGILYNQSGERGERFDFGRFDEIHNLARFWSLCFGRRRLHNGDEVWKKELNKPKRKRWKALASELGQYREEGKQDLEVARSEPTILGEIQKGNWGLAQRDFFKLVGAQTQVDVDLYVYVVPDGQFEGLLSSDIVTRGRVLERLPGYRQVVNVPTLIVSMDCDLV